MLDSQTNSSDGMAPVALTIGCAAVAVVLCLIFCFLAWACMRSRQQARSLSVASTPEGPELGPPVDPADLKASLQGQGPIIKPLPVVVVCPDDSVHVALSDHTPTHSLDSTGSCSCTGSAFSQLERAGSCATEASGALSLGRASSVSTCRLGSTNLGPLHEMQPWDADTSTLPIGFVVIPPPPAVQGPSAGAAEQRPGRLPGGGGRGSSDGRRESGQMMPPNELHLAVLYEEEERRRRQGTAARNASLLHLGFCLGMGLPSVY